MFIFYGVGPKQNTGCSKSTAKAQLTGDPSAKWMSKQMKLCTPFSCSAAAILLSPSPMLLAPALLRRPHGPGARAIPWKADTDIFTEGWAVPTRVLQKLSAQNLPTTSCGCKPRGQNTILTEHLAPPRAQGSPFSSSFHHAPARKLAVAISEQYDRTIQSLPVSQQWAK